MKSGQERAYANSLKNAARVSELEKVNKCQAEELKRITSENKSLKSQIIQAGKETQLIKSKWASSEREKNMLKGENKSLLVEISQKSEANKMLINATSTAIEEKNKFCKDVVDLARQLDDKTKEADSLRNTLKEVRYERNRAECERKFLELEVKNLRSPWYIKFLRWCFG